MSLHYIYDPLCGWCYAAAPLLDDLLGQHPELPVQLHAGGLFTEQAITPPMAKHIRDHDAHIHILSGQPFGEPYLSGLLNDNTTLLDSGAVIAAILAITALDEPAAIPMLKAIQVAHYQDGLKVVNESTLTSLAVELGQSGDVFQLAYRDWLGEKTQQHIIDTRKLMAKTRISGFPGFAWEDDTGELRVIDHNAYYGKPKAFTESFKIQTTI